MNAFHIHNTKSLDPCELLMLLRQHKLLKITDHTLSSTDDLIAFSKTLGPLLEWDFGLVNELKYHPNAKNYLYSDESVPFHWDGAFHVAPYLLIFHCITAPQKNNGGQTLFSDTTKLYDDLNPNEQSCLSNIKLNYKTEKIAHYGGEIKCRPISTHPITHEKIIRFAEPVLSAKNPVSLSFESESKHEEKRIISLLTKKLYEKPYCYQHQWQDNDLIIADNHALLHARKAFSQTSFRHINRTQILGS